MACEIKPKERAGIINPMYTCQPAGAQYASIGVEDCTAIVHGGQGCVMFVRLLFSQHLNENFDIASSSLHEDAAVLGAVHRIEAAVDVLLMRYPHVKVVPIITTCSTEIIGDDVEGVVRKLNKGLLKEKYADREIHLITVHTPSFKGSQVSGYDAAVTAFIKHFAEKTEPNGKINLITGWVDPGDVKELKHLLNMMDIDATVLFDIESFDSPLMPDGKSEVSHGSTTIEDMRGTANAIGTIALNRYEGGKAAEYLKDKFEVPAVIGPTPIGIRNTDILVKSLSTMTGKPIPAELVRERGKAIDALQDLTHMFFADKKVAIFGHPDFAIGMAEFCMDLEMKPVLLLIGDENPGYAKDPRLLALKDSAEFDMEIITNADLWELENRVKNEGLEVDLILGHSKGRWISIDNDIPMLRVGFPVFDRAGYYRHPKVGYNGAVWLAEEMANVIFNDMERKKDREWLLAMW